MKPADMSMQPFNNCQNNCLCNVHFLLLYYSILFTCSQREYFQHLGPFYHYQQFNCLCNVHFFTTVYTSLFSCSFKGNISSIQDHFIIRS